MAHNNRIRFTGTWTAGSVILPAEMEQIDQELYESLNGDQGGTWAPASTIIIGGAGMRVTAPLIADDLSGHVKSGKVIQVDLGGLIDVFGKIYIEPDATLEVKGTSGHPGLVQFDRYAQGTWQAGSFLTVAAASGAVGAAILDLYGIQKVRSGGVLQVLASGLLEIAPNGQVLADNGSGVGLYGTTIIADLSGGGGNGTLNIGAPFFGVGHVVLNGSGCDITANAGSTIYVGGLSGSGALLEVRNHSSIQLDNGSTLLALPGSTVGIGNNAFLNVVAGGTLFVNGVSGTPAFASWGAFGIASFGSGAQLNLGAGAIVNCDTLAEFRGIARFVNHLHVAGAGDVVFEDGSTVLDFSNYTREGPLTRTGNTAYESFRKISGASNSTHYNGLEQDIIVMPVGLSADITYTMDDILPSEAHVEVTFVQSKDGTHDQGGDIIVQATSGGGLFTMKNSGLANAGATIVWTGGLWHLKSSTPLQIPTTTDGTAITIP